MKLTKLWRKWSKSLLYFLLTLIPKIYLWGQTWQERRNEDIVRYAKVCNSSWKDITKMAVRRNYFNKIPLITWRPFFFFFFLNFPELDAIIWGKIWKVIGKQQSDTKNLIRKSGMKVTALTSTNSPSIFRSSD